MSYSSCSAVMHPSFRAIQHHYHYYTCKVHILQRHRYFWIFTMLLETVFPITKQIQLCLIPQPFIQLDYDQTDSLHVMLFKYFNSPLTFLVNLSTAWYINRICLSSVNKLISNKKRAFYCNMFKWIFGALSSCTHICKNISFSCLTFLIVRVGALVQWLWMMTHVRKVVGLNLDGDSDIFHVDLF